MALPLNELLGYGNLVPVTVLVADQTVKGEKPILRLEVKRDLKTFRIGAIGKPAIDSLLAHAEKRKNEIVVEIPEKLLVEGDKMSWLTTPY
jgi:hypothetical protein